MGFLESSRFCTFEEYTNNRPKRIDGQNVRPDELYTYMLQLQGSVERAAKMPIRMHEIARHAGIVSIKFAFLDANLNAVFNSQAFVREDGIIPGMNIVITDEVAKEDFCVAECYLRDYFDDQFGGFLEQSTGLLAGV